MSPPLPATLISDIPDSLSETDPTAMTKTFMHLWAEFGWFEGTSKYPKLSHAVLQMERLYAGWYRNETATSFVISGLNPSASAFKSLLSNLDENSLGPIHDAFEFVEGLPKLKLWISEVSTYDDYLHSVCKLLFDYFTEVQKEGVDPEWKDFSVRHQKQFLRLEKNTEVEKEGIPLGWIDSAGRHQNEFRRRMGIL
jgi:hypothetical protein